ncbi:sigma-70 family RNA polymerase sigma factor [Streptomyces sp. NRRL S-87]|uniref:sigma-70 family RNA polymerase sigma factor n=1 Tax=Streptomyces sp. NRRL S-87 TaxID=1463920 RepID=UPI0004BF6D27|nr:sigma-70 family RNA polymerase sigma factor [Streptomyces sp. NRRL S-87]
MTPALTKQLPTHGETTSRRAPDPEAEVTRLALEARDGDPAKADRFVRALQRDVWRYVAYLSADPQAADDLTQDVFLRALAALPRFEGRSSARTWLLSIARRTVVDSLRRAAARPRLSHHQDWQSAAEQAQPHGVPGFEDGIALAELLALLPAERREAFVLTQLLGLNYAEAAEAAGCPIGTVRSRVARARTHLVTLLTEAPAAARTPADPPVPLTGRWGRSAAERLVSASRA